MTRPALAATLSLCLCALAARAAPAPPAAPSELSEERARQILPRAPLHDLTNVQRAQFLEIAGDTFDYAGCNDTLARCLSDQVKDQHALRMAQLIKIMLVEGYNATAIIDLVERYYGSFAKEKRHKLREDDCPVLGNAKAPITVVEYSDFQCPHCATAFKPLHDLVRAMKDKVRLCSKYFPLPGHPRSMQAAGAAEFANRHDKFWEMSERLFAHQDQLDDGQLKTFAKELGLDGNAMLKDIYAGKFDVKIEKQKKEGVDAGVNATPSLYFNGRKFTLPLKAEFLVFSAQDEEEWLRNQGWDKE